MTSTTDTNTTANTTYLNPVYGRDFPDPFILKHAGEYWAYSTGLQSDGRAFGVLHSTDLVNWREQGGALTPIAGEHPCYWAPEVTYENGRFLMYYSVGNERRMHVRVAFAEHPSGPFTDSGHQLTDAEFAIDPHVYTDADGTRWLFYATDFLTHTHIGTGTVRDRMLDAFTLAGDPRPVTRARYDWQVYDPERKEKGGVRWHTVEGPFVLRRKNLYYQMFSGGNWQNVTYGVSYAVSESIEREDEWEQVADGARVLPILRTIPERVIGPGHNSVVRGPNNQQLFCVYHRWDGERGRVLAIDRLDWVGERITVLGATTTPQRAPDLPTFTGFSGEHENGLGEGWMCTAEAGGRWSVRAGEARYESSSASDARASARCRALASSFILEVSLRALDMEGARGRDEEAGAFGVALLRDEECALQFLLEPAARAARVEWGTQDDARVRFALPLDFEPPAQHLLRIVVDHSLVTIFLDERVVRWQGILKAAPDFVALVTTEGASAAFKGFELTHGWEELFTQTERTLAARGWQGNFEGWRLEDDLLRFDDEAGCRREGSIHRGPLLASYELVVNVQLERESVPGEGGYGFHPAYIGGANAEEAAAATELDPLITVERDGGAEGKWALFLRSLKNASPSERWTLPESFDPFVMQQFRFRKQNGRLAIYLEATPLCEIATTTEATAVGLYAQRARVAYDMVRVSKTVTSDK